jgi:protein-S-isoprenylcysteine O-methyltransferase Ste14
VLLPFAYYIVLTRRFIEPEEAGLRRLFGAEAHAYLEKTRRWSRSQAAGGRTR